MRKRIIISLLALAVIGVVAFFVSQPKEGSVEYHKRAYLHARDGSRFFNERRVDWYRISGHRPKFRPQTPDSLAEMEIHERALIDLGYIDERTFQTEFGAQAAARQLFTAFAINGTLHRKVIVERPIARIVDFGSNYVVVRCARQDMPKWEAVLAKRKRSTRVIRKVDMGELLVPKINLPDSTR